MPSSNPLDDTNYTTLLSGRSWHDGTRSVTFSFPANVPGNPITGLLPDERAFAELALARANEVSNINLVAAPTGTTGHITFVRDTTTDAYGYASYPPMNGVNAPVGSGGDIAIGTIPEQLAAALYNTGWQTYLHELGHALGLRHPFDNSPFLNAALDNQQYTVMAYAAHPNQSSLPLLDQAWPATFMLYDLQALQSLYGANMTTRSGDTFYFGASGEYALADNGKLIMTIWDGGGNDTIDASNQTGNSIVDLRPGYYSSIGAVANNITIALGVGGQTQSAWIENANGGSGNDTLTGNQLANVLDGGAGNDTMAGGVGNDLYVVDSAGDTVVEDANAGLDRVISTISYALGDHVEVLTLSGAGAIDGTGNGLNNAIKGNDAANTLSGGEGNDVLSGGADNDTLNGGSGNDSLDGGTGNDTMTGGAGNDLYGVDSAGDTVAEAANEGIDRVFSTISYLLGDNVEFLTLSGAGAIDGTGNGLNNAINGNGAANTLSGGEGNDVLSGGADNDTLNGDQGNDRLDGGTGNDTVTGGAGNDVLTGGAGVDAMTGGTGNDTYHVDDVGDAVSEDSNAGVDTVVSTITYALTGNVEVLTLSGASAIDGTGNALTNWIRGNGANNVIAGGQGNDALEGNAGMDSLSGGEGNDSLTGGAGADRFVFAFGQGIDTIRDFETGTDKIVIDGAGFGVSSIVLHANGNPASIGPGGQFLYDTDNGALSFDSDGAGGTASVWFATLTTRPLIAASDFELV